MNILKQDEIQSYMCAQTRFGKNIKNFLLLFALIIQTVTVSHNC